MNWFDFFLGGLSVMLWFALDLFRGHADWEHWILNAVLLVVFCGVARLVQWRRERRLA